MTANFEDYVKTGSCDQHIPEIDTAIKQPARLTADQAYWLAKCIMLIQNNSYDDKILIAVLRQAFSSGLTFSSNSERYIETAQIIARLHIRNGEYSSALKYLMTLATRMNSVPDWVHIHYILCQIMSQTILHTARNPQFYFRRMNQISSNSHAYRAKLHRIALHRLQELAIDNPQILDAIQTFEAYNTTYLSHSYENREDTDAAMYCELNLIYKNLETNTGSVVNKPDSEAETLETGLKQAAASPVKIEKGNNYDDLLTTVRDRGSDRTKHEDLSPLFAKEPDIDESNYSVPSKLSIRQNKAFIDDELE